MLFFNFLWLFYLMVLINGYTISKSDEDYNTPDSFVDSLRDPERGRGPRARHRRGRRHQEPAPTLVDKTTQVSTARLKDFWKRFRHRNKTTKSKHSTINGNTDEFHNYYNGKKRPDSRNQKREISSDFVFSKGFFRTSKDFFANTKNNQVKFFNLTSIEPTSICDNITSVTSSLTSPTNGTSSVATTKPTQCETTAKTLSTLQSILDSKKSSLRTTTKTKTHTKTKPHTKTQTTAQTTSSEWVGTAQLEALLENIKARAMQVLGDNSPTVTSLITNSVNEVTFAADPSLHHIDQSTPHLKAATIVKSSNIHKRTTEPTNTDHTTHYILKRSPFETVSTVAQSVEDMLQSELKKVYKKLKGKVSSYQKEKSTKITVPCNTTCPIKKTTKTTKPLPTPICNAGIKMKKKKPLMKAHHRVAKATGRFGKKKKVTSTSSTTENPLTSVDDSKMINLLEQILLKTSEYNVLRMMTTPFTSKSNKERLSKRNVETLADLKLKEQIEGYEPGEIMPDTLDDEDNIEEVETTSALPDVVASTYSTEGISFESISDKISYNDYVNGYKYYLKYQQEQEQDDERFSPMIRYQAHKHHRVDDIGKFILGKIPQIRFARNIFDDIDMDDQDISTKSDDSWFKKHFYMFLDNNTPKKFYTSETVSLKSALTEPSLTLGKPRGQSRRPPPARPAAHEEAPLINLDQLAQNLESYKMELSSTTMSSLVKQLMAENKEEPVENGFMIKMMSRLLGGKDRRALKKATLSEVYQSEPRFKRHTKKSKHKEKNTMQKLSEPGVPESKDKFSKLGVVQMIAQPTTVVKIPAKKKSKLQNLMRKFHLSNKEKNNKKTKRHARRKQRFVHFKRIKEMLLGLDHENRGTARSEEVSDFDIMTSEIDTFKAEKFSRVPNVDEMRKEIPEITDELLGADEVPDTTKSVARTHPALDPDSSSTPTLGPDRSTTPTIKYLDSTDVSVEFHPVKSQAPSNATHNMIEQMTMTQLEHYLVDYKKSMKGATTKLDKSGTRPPDEEKTATVHTLKYLEDEDTNIMEDLLPQNNINEDEVPAKNEGRLEFNDKAAPKLNINNSTPSQESLNDIREEIDKLKSKLTMYKPLDTSAQKLGPDSGDVTAVTKAMFVPARILKLKKKGTERNKKNNIRKRADPQKLKPEREMVDFESAIETPTLYEFSNDVNYSPVNRFAIPFIPRRRDSSHFAKKPKSMHQIESYTPQKSLSEYSVSPDHFGELLLWHSDILNVDLLTTTSYGPCVDKLVGMAGYTTPNAAILANEVQDMKRFISNLQPVYYLKNVSNTCKNAGKRITNTERYVSMPSSTVDRDEYTASENEVVFLGQAQYFAFSKDENPDYGYGPTKAAPQPNIAKSKPEKQTTNEATSRPILKRVSSRSNRTYLSPRPNVVYNTVVRSRNVSRLWRNPKRTRQPINKLLASQKPLIPTSKTNQAPEQYFSTPLPMDSQDFNDFLKKSNLDVDSVTAPISDSELNMSTERLRDTASINDFKLLPSMKTVFDSEKFSASTLRLISDKENLMKTLNQLKLSAKNLSEYADEDPRLRRHKSDFNRINNVPTLTTKFIKRRKIFGRKTSLLPSVAGDQSEYADSSRKNKINVDYEAQYDTEDLAKYTPERPETVNVEMTKLNNLLYFFIPGKNFTTSTTKESLLAQTEKVTVELPKMTEIPQLIRKFDLKHNNNPKRVRISYHYDIVYENRPKKGRTRGSAASQEENIMHNSEVGEVAKRRDRVEAKSKLANKNINFSEKPLQAKLRLSKDKIHRYRRKSKRNANASVTEKPILSKRNADPVTYTAQNVAAFEIYLDMSKSTPATTNMTSVPEISALQVHIALPNDQQSIMKRQLTPFKPVFRAKMSDAVNLEYQVPVLEAKITTESHSLSPGLYMLVDNLYKSGHVTLKPVLSDLSMLKQRQVVAVKITTEKTSQKCATTNPDELKKVTLNKDFIAAVNKHLVQLYENFSSLSSADKNINKSHVPAQGVKKTEVANRTRRDVWPSLKEMLGGERTCSCHFKENHTLCPACVATDAVVEEIIFEFNNLANFMKDHCTEIQTFFWMNPNGGKKLTDSVHRLDRMLHDYYKRMKGKCQGKTCQALATRLDKRALSNRRRKFKEFGLIPEDVHFIAIDIANILKHRLPYNKTLKENGEEFLNVVDNCLPGVRYKKSTSNQRDNTLEIDKHINDKISRKYVKHLMIGHKKENYKREASQVEKPLISDSGAFFFSHYLNRRSTKPQTVEKLPLMTETSLNALTHNINELFLLLNNMNLTDIDPLSQLAKKDESQNKKNKMYKKKKTKLKKIKKKHKSIHRLHKKIKEQKQKDKTNSSSEYNVNTDALMSMTTDKTSTTRVLKLILSNLQQSPSLYITDDKITASANHTTSAVSVTTKTNPTLMHKLSGTSDHEVLPTGETIIFEEGCVKSGFLNKLKNLFAVNNNTNTATNNYLYEKRSVRAPTVTSEKTNLTLDISTTAPMPTMTILTASFGQSSDNIARIAEPTFLAPRALTCQTEEPKSPEHKSMCPPSDGPKYTAEPCKLKERKCPPESPKAEPCDDEEPESPKTEPSEDEEPESPKTEPCDDKEPECPTNEACEDKEPKCPKNAACEDKEPKCPKNAACEDKEQKCPTDAACEDKEPKCPKNAACEDKEPKCPKNAACEDKEQKCPTDAACEDKEPKYPTTKYPIGEAVKYISTSTTDNSVIVYETPNDKGEEIITLITDPTYPTIIIIDEVSKETATDEVNLDIVSTGRDAKELLMSVLRFEKQKLYDEYRSLRDSRQVDFEAKEADYKLFAQQSTTKCPPASFATGNYSLIAELVNAATKMMRKSQKTTKDPMTGPAKIFPTASYDTYGKWSPLVKIDKSYSKLTSPLSLAATTTKVTQSVTMAPQVQTITSPQLQSMIPQMLIMTTPQVQTMPTTVKPITVAMVKETTKAQQKKASDARPLPPAPAPHLCDISATVEHVVNLQRRLSRSAFEQYVRNLTCSSYRVAPKYFVVAEDRKRDNERIAKSNNSGGHNLKLRWNWIRNQRRVNTKDFIPDEQTTETRSDNNKNCNVENKLDDMLVNFVVDDDFEKFFKGEHGIYKMGSRRKKRKANATNLTKELTDLPPLHSTPNEILTVSGDSVVLHCPPNRKSPAAPDKRLWTADPGALLRRPNVKMDGQDISIDGIRENNAGSYVCMEGPNVRRRVQVRVLELPRFQIFFTPTYTIQEDSCGYTDLKAIRSLAAAMSHLVCPGGQCSVNLHEPHCLKDRSDGAALLRATASLELRDPGVNCSATCRRDLVTQLVKIAVENVPKLVTINGLIAGNKNKTLVPFTTSGGSFAVTRRLRRKDSTRHRKRYNHLPPGSVDVVVNCPRRYQLLPKYKICDADLPNSRYKEKHRNNTGHRPRRYEQWWWYPPCGYLAAASLAALGCAACAVCAVLARHTRPADRGQGCWAEAAGRPASPSRVILARLFKRSLSAFRHTDSQDTRSFPTKPVPPPLPPIDFD